VPQQTLKRLSRPLNRLPVKLNRFSPLIKHSPVLPHPKTRRVANYLGVPEISTGKSGAVQIVPRVSCLVLSFHLHLNLERELEADQYTPAIVLPYHLSLPSASPSLLTLSKMPLSSLPTELVRQIIESTVPSTLHSTTYRERQSALRSLCLVSHRLQQIAQPLLREVVSFATTRRLVADLELLDTEVFHDSVRDFMGSDRSWLDLNLEMTRRFIANARNLRTLVLDRDGYSSFDLSNLNSLSSMYLSFFRIVFVLS